VQEAYSLNVPLLVVDGNAEPFSAFITDTPSVLIDAVKPAEDGSGDVILRLYEAKKGETNCALRFGLAFEFVWECDMLENRKMELPITNNQVALYFKAFEVKTLRMQLKR
jgi:alpha-mannosidase